MSNITTSSVPLVDTHAHVFTRSLPFISGTVHTFDRDFPTGAFVQELKTAGVRYASIAAASFLGPYVDYTLDALSNHSFLRATINADPEADFGFLRELDSAGVVGIRFAVGNMKQSPDLSTEPYRNLLASVTKLGWHVHVFSRAEQLPPLLHALNDAGANVVVDHFGARDNHSGPDSESFQAVIRAIRRGRTWVKLSGPYLSSALDHHDMAQRFLREAGAERLLWGSDWPFVAVKGRLTYQQAIAWLSEWVPDPAVRAQIDRNALALYRFASNP